MATNAFHHLTTVGAVILLAILLAACTRPEPLDYYRGNVQSMAADDADRYTTFFPMPGNEAVSRNSLLWEEHSRRLVYVLEAKGLTRAETFEEADLAVFLAASVGDPRERITTTTQTRPVTRHVTGSAITPGGGIRTYQGMVHSYETHTHQRSRTVIDRGLELNAIDVEEYLRSGDLQSVWSVQVTTSGRSSDLQRMVPVMLVAAFDSIGTHDPGASAFVLWGADPRIGELMRE